RELVMTTTGSFRTDDQGYLRTGSGLVLLDAARAKARRGELRISVPIGYIWHREVATAASARRWRQRDWRPGAWSCIPWRNPV
ncbi:hypothetical protein VB636_00045, partial [Paracoccus sp. APAP_BH8]|uniref:hypothetical protein n=1 Tax=Paracoccus sp. APAP_BH8 TaxID=3110237 RepID=UPI002FD7B5A8